MTKKAVALAVKSSSRAGLNLPYNDYFMLLLRRKGEVEDETSDHCG